MKTLETQIVLKEIMDQINNEIDELVEVAEADYTGNAKRLRYYDEIKGLEKARKIIQDELLGF